MATGNDFGARERLVMSVAISVLAGLMGVGTWTLSDMRTELKEKLSLREHQEFKDKLNNLAALLAEQDKNRITNDVFARELRARDDKWRAQEEINRQAIAAFLQIESFKQYKENVDRQLERMQRYIDDEKHK